ncbi:hypothetical protein GHI93_00010 [Lactococcus hircilactis]|uniref:ATP-binding protein n=1 Tax=Lactococcus hircilactis TaxID=1494462 RepID=A0A7X1Z6A7_9LACT|nr:ATP-binding protein [Lactococcus hircilactis]MQW38338.1 hypothetical protein [Lactococcus hircilactis]
MTKNKLIFSIANNAVTHLGRNLYSSMPPALAELVANSYDAYATQVIIDLCDDNSMIIADNGKGLSFEEFESKYVTIGNKKQEEKIFGNFPKRNPMGEKGIGKLAAFSLGEEYSVYSKTLNSNQWISFTLSYKDMIESGEQHETDTIMLESLPENLAKFQTFKSGFIVHCKKLRKNPTKATKDSTVLQLSRRFYLNQENFSVQYDGEEIPLKTNFYYQNLEYLIYFGYSEQEINDIFDSNVEKEKFKGVSSVLNFIEANNIKGWIGSVGKPKDLKENTDNIIVYTNGKVADEDILKNKKEARIAKSYIVGEIQADYFSNLDDPITSSRQGLDDSLEEVEAFIDNVEGIRRDFINKWNDFRKRNMVEKLPNRIKENESYKDWLSNLSPTQRDLNGKLLNLFSSKLDDDENEESEEVDSMVTAIASVINNVETDELLQTLKSEENSSNHFDLLAKLMKNIAIKEDLSHAEIIKSRVKIIEQLEKLMEDSSSLEKLFEFHLAENPWLINPYWNIDKNSIEGANSLSTQVYQNTDIDGDFQKAFLDILIRIAEENYPVIVELKKNEPTGHARVTFAAMLEQIKKYRKAIQQKFPELKPVTDTDIKAVFIITEDAGAVGSGNKIEFEHYELETFKNLNIEVVKYNDIVSKSKKMYREHLKLIQDAKIVPNLSKVE